MKKARLLFALFSVLLLVMLGCNGSDDSSVNRGSETGTETSFNFTMTSFKSQETASSSVGVQADFTADQIMTGSLTATPSGGGTAQVFDWSIYFDETTWDVQSNKTIILAPGTYDFSLLITKGSQEYAGTAAGVSISDGTFDVPMTISPVIGDTVTDVTLVASLADFKFQYDPAELSAASLSNPQMGIIVDGGTEEIFTINPATGISDNYVNLPEGSHTVQLKLYEASLQVGRSITAQESVIITAGLDLAMDLVALHGETTFALTEAGGDAYFDFNIPAEVVDEAGGLGNLQVLFSMVGPNNPLEENVLNVVSDGSGGYEADITLTNKQFDEVDISLAFTDTSVPELLGSCTMEATLDTTQRTLNCDVTLRRRAIVGGSLLATLGINVFNEASEPVAGATVSENGNILGITGSGAFGTEGYLKVYLTTGDYTITADNGIKNGSQTVNLSALDVKNIDIVLNVDSSDGSILADTGQSICYDIAGSVISCPAPGNLLAQDGSYVSTPPSFTDNGDGTVTDNNTTLMWQQADNLGNRSWAGAQTICGNSVLAGYTDWRLPTVRELRSVVDFGFNDPAIDPVFFPGTSALYFWTSTPYVLESDYYWFINFLGGYTWYEASSGSMHVRCVRGNSNLDIWQMSFVDQGDGTVAHLPTGLIWQKEDDGVGRNWEDSLNYCEGLSLSGQDDWRLPNTVELMILVDFSTGEPAIDSTLFPNTQNASYWSSTTTTGYAHLAWYINFSSGFAGDSGKSSGAGITKYYVRCVRSD